jgi:hypothetical protein
MVCPGGRVPGNSNESFPAVFSKVTGRVSKATNRPHRPLLSRRRIMIISESTPALAAVPTRPHEQSPAIPAMRRAKDLAAELYIVHAIPADVHELQSGKAAVSVYCGLLVYTDGESFRWTSPTRHRSGALLISAVQAPAAAELLAEHYKILLSRDGIDLLRSELPLLGDVLPIHLREVLDAAPV